MDEIARFNQERWEALAGKAVLLLPGAAPGSWEHFTVVLPPWLWPLFSYSC